MKSQSFSLLSEVAKTSSTGCRFASFVYTNSQGEVARHTVALGIDILKAYRRDLALLEYKISNLKGIAQQACQEMIDSLKESIKKGVGSNSGYTCKDVYEQVARGIKSNKSNNELYISGFSLKKEIISEGKYKSVNSNPKTLAKKELQKGMKSSRFRQFKLPGLSLAKINGKTLEIKEIAAAPVKKEKKIRATQNQENYIDYEAGRHPHDLDDGEYQQ